MAFGIACLKHRVKWLGVIAFDFAGMLRIVVGSDALLVSQPACGIEGITRALAARIHFDETIECIVFECFALAFDRFRSPLEITDQIVFQVQN